MQDRDDTFIAATESNMTFYTTVNIMLEKKTFGQRQYDCDRNEEKRS